MAFYLDNIAKIGLEHTKIESEKKTIVLVNHLSVVISAAVWIMLGIRYLAFELYPDWYICSASLLFLVPLLLNYLGFVKISGLCMCWWPPMVLLAIYIFQLKQLTAVFTSQYDGIYIYLLSVSSTPFLVLSYKNKVQFFAGILVPASILFFCDPILNFFEVGHKFKGSQGDLYEMNRMRSIIAYVILGGSCFSLKWLLERGEEEKGQLILELASRNKIIEEQARVDLQEAASRLALATDYAGIGIWELNIDTEELIWDQQMHLMCGIDSEVSKATDWRHHIHPEDLEEMEEKANRSIMEGTLFSHDFRTLWPNGEVRHLESIGKTYKKENKPFRMIGACWDISDRKKTEEQLLQSEANLYATINNTTFSIWSINRNFVIISLNKPFRHYLRDKYKLEVEEGTTLGHETLLGVNEFSPAWVKNYIRAMAGESFELLEESAGRYFKYSLNPIIENAMISGVTVFMEETTELRTKELALWEAQKQIGELKLMALRSAMNPHFIFNTLNSIQSFILKNDQINAINYLSTFAKLIRSILNNSVTNKIKLADELEQIKNYVHLEMLRFDQEFDFVLTIDENIDVDNIEISSMLIQPYVENAILHGLYNKSEKGTLWVSVKEERDAVLFEIEDDGVGREAASKYRFKSIKDHTSLGTTLTEERLKLINIQNGVSPEIEDLFEDGVATGTRVKIWVN